MSPTPDPARTEQTGSRPLAPRRPAVVVWGTYDTGKPRTRNLLAAMRRCDWDVVECHVDVWGGVEDKTQLKRPLSRFLRLLRWMLAYPLLILRYLALPRHDLVLVGYMGQLDVLVLWPLARLRRVPIVWDALISLYNTTVNERGWYGPRHPAARLLFVLEWLGCRTADRVLANTVTATRFFVETYAIPQIKARPLFVGVETHAFPPRSPRASVQGPIRVLFYGTLIPLHGVQTILEAARLARDEDIVWHLIGSGQEADLVEQFLARDRLEKVRWRPWVPYEELAPAIHACDVGLGIFGDGIQARWSIPNKVFQMLSCGVPIVTRDSPGARELLSPEMPGIYLVPPKDPDAIVGAIHAYAARREQLSAQVLHRDVVQRFDEDALARQLESITEGLLPSRASVTAKRKTTP